MWTEKQNPFSNINHVSQKHTPGSSRARRLRPEWRDVMSCDVIWCVWSITLSLFFISWPLLPYTSSPHLLWSLSFQRSWGRGLGVWGNPKWRVFGESVGRFSALARFVLRFLQSLFEFIAVGQVALLYLLHPFPFLLLQDGQEVLQLGHRERIPLKHTHTRYKLLNVVLTVG